MKLSAVYFTSAVALDEGERVQCLRARPDDGSGDAGRFDSLERLDDGRIVACRGDVRVVVQGVPCVYVEAAPVQAPLMRVDPILDRRKRGK